MKNVKINNNKKMLYKNILYYTKKLLCFALIFMSAFVFFACDETKKTTLSISGGVYFNGQGLENVTIHTSSNTYTITGNDGKFSFTEKTNKIVIYPQKDGYTFSPKEQEITASTENIQFIATKIENLVGTLSLSAIQITPTSIAHSDIDKFIYKNEENSDCLKISQIYVKFSGNTTSQKTESTLSEPIFAQKNKKTEIAIKTDFSVQTCKSFSIDFSVDAYHNVAGSEQIFTETVSTKKQITENQTNANLINFSKNEYGQIVYSFSAINSTDAKFTYDITFVFDFYPD